MDNNPELLCSALAVHACKTATQLAALGLVQKKESVKPMSPTDGSEGWPAGKLGTFFWMVEIWLLLQMLQQHGLPLWESTSLTVIIKTLWEQ